jgi:hypothetical protein
MARQAVAAVGSPSGENAYCSGFSCRFRCSFAFRPHLSHGSHTHPKSRMLVLVITRAMLRIAAKQVNLSQPATFDLRHLQEHHSRRAGQSTDKGLP